MYHSRIKARIDTFSSGKMLALVLSIAIVRKLCLIISVEIWKYFERSHKSALIGVCINREKITLFCGLKFKKNSKI